MNTCQNTFPSHKSGWHQLRNWTFLWTWKIRLDLFCVFVLFYRARIPIHYESKRTLSQAIKCSIISSLPTRSRNKDLDQNLHLETYIPAFPISYIGVRRIAKELSGRRKGYAYVYRRLQMLLFLHRPWLEQRLCVSSMTSQRKLMIIDSSIYLSIHSLTEFWIKQVESFTSRVWIWDRDRH